MSERECKFQIGDLVMLVSGGPVMTVIGSYYDTVLCEWRFDDAGGVSQAVFKPECLELTIAITIPKEETWRDRPPLL